MKTLSKSILCAAALAGLWLVDFAPDTSLIPTLVGEAQAIVGRPATPVSAAGVARRTTRRAVYATSASTASAQQQQAAAQQQQQPAAAPASQLPAGTVVTALPSGCQSTTVDGVSLFNCGGVMYRPTFQSNNLVYVVQ